MIDLSLLISPLYVGDTRKTYPVIDSPIHGEQNGANCNPVSHSSTIILVCAFFFPILPVQINFSVFAAL